MAIAAAGLLLLPAGCGRHGGNARPDDRVVVHYWEKWTGFEGETMRRVVDAFNALQDRIEVRYLPVSQIERKLMLATAGGNPPDIAGLYAAVLPAYAENNALTPLDGMLRGSTISLDDYLPVLAQACRHRGFTWAVPSTPATLALHWNKKLFREAGLDPEKPPRSLAELEAMNEILYRADAGGRIERLGHSPQEPGWWSALWVYWFGGDLWRPQEGLCLDSAPMRATFEWLRTYPERFGGASLQSLRNGFGNFASPQNAFFQGRVAMVLQGPWLYNFIRQYAPPDFEWGVAAFPSIDPERFPGVTLAECDVLVIPAGARHPREALAFLEYVSSPAVIERLCLGHQKFSPRREVSEAFYARHPNPHIREFVKLAASPNARLAPPLTTWNELKNELTVAIDQMVLTGGDPGEAIRRLEERQSRAYRRKEIRWERVAGARQRAWQEKAEAP